MRKPTWIEEVDERGERGEIKERRDIRREREEIRREVSSRGSRLVQKETEERNENLV